MDLSELLGGANGSDLDALAQTTPGGELLFKQPFGDSTIWATATGQVRVTVIFDPFLPWGRCNVMASTAGDFLADFRQRLSKYLIPESVAPTEPTCEEVEMETVRRGLPDKVFTKYLEESSSISKYAQMLRDKASAQYREDQALRSALASRDFRFTYHLAIDSYPQESGKGASRRHAAGSKSAAASHERLGVLVINLEGRPAESAQTGSEPAKIGIDGDSAAMLSPPTSPGLGPVGSTTAVKPTLRRHRNPKSATAQQELEELLNHLEISAERLEKGHNEWLKELPKTAEGFFDQLGSWFGAVLQRKQQQLSEADGKSSSLYR